MRLNEIKNSITGFVDLKEGVIPPHISMTLNQVASAGKITNNVQTFILSNLVSIFKDGGPTRWPRDVNPYHMNTSSELIQSIRALSDEEVVALCNWLQLALQTPANFEANPYCSPQRNVGEWFKWVLQKQD